MKSAILVTCSVLFGLGTATAAHAGGTGPTLGDADPAAACTADPANWNDPAQHARTLDRLDWALGCHIIDQDQYGVLRYSDVANKKERTAYLYPSFGFDADSPPWKPETEGVRGPDGQWNCHLPPPDPHGNVVAWLFTCTETRNPNIVVE
jgi:hypothetical protein